MKQRKGSATRARQTGGSLGLRRGLPSSAAVLEPIQTQTLRSKKAKAIRPFVHELVPGPSATEVFERLAAWPHVVFFDSAMRHSTLGRFSFVTADPFDWLTSRGQQIRLASEAHPRGPADPFAVLKELLGRYAMEPIADLPLFQGGAAGMFGYELCHHIEQLPHPRIDEFETPDLAVGFYDWVIAFDHERDRAWVISTGLPERDPVERRRRAQVRLSEVLRRVHSPAEPCSRHRTSTTVQPCTQWPTPFGTDLTSNFSRETYLDTVRCAIEYINAGDCFQVNVAQRLLARATIAPLELYRRLRECNAAPFAGYFDLGDFVIVSASPERFLRVEKKEVQTRPIKGTRPRGSTPEEDRAEIQKLLASVKDRAENIMIVDLLRNDLGRVCRYGSVQVSAVCRLESYPYVHHLVSEVRGRLREDTGPVDLLRAAFPGGSVTGAPKIRAMEIIAELEPTTRGPYCGSLGFIGFDGSMDTNILIRTFTCGRGWVQFPVGGGIVADSVPEHEYDETWHKAVGLLRALR